MEILHETNQFISFLENNERWLIRRLLYYAGNSGYTTDQILTSEHNKSLIKGVIDSVIETAIRYGITFTNLHPDNPIRLFGKNRINYGNQWEVPVPEHDRIVTCKVNALGHTV